MPATTPQDRERYVIVAVERFAGETFVHENPSEITLWSDGRGPVSITYRAASI